MTDNDKTEQPKILLVDDNEELRKAVGAYLENKKFLVVTAANVSEALHLIDTEPFDVLLTDLQMPEAGDGFTVVSAMRHKNPNVVTLVFTGYPALQEAADAILLQADEVLLKPMAMSALVAVIRDALGKHKVKEPTNTERVASILEREAATTISDWLDRVDGETELTRVSLTREQRTGHLPKLLQELVQRLRVPRKLGTKQVSQAAVQHGKVRHSQGYSISMIIEESRILQVSIFHTLQKNLKTVNFSLLLLDVMTIADECDSQLKQTINSFVEQSTRLAA